MERALRPRIDDRRLLRGRRFALRQAVAPLRALPDFVIVGEMKCGTSSLFNWLARTSRIARPTHKEVQYFGLGARHGKSETWYRAHFPLRHQLRGALTGEATPGYLFEPGALERLTRRLPQARLIVLLRDPVERAISHYFHEVRVGRESLSLEEALACEAERLARARAEGDIETLMHASYRTRGIYADSLERLFALVPREQVLVMASEPLFADPAAGTARALAFLGLPPEMPWDLGAVNVGGNRKAVDPALRADLEEFFRPHDRRLARLLGETPAWMRSGAQTPQA